MNIEDRFKEAFDKFEVDPGDQLWTKIQSEIPSSPTSSLSGQAASAGAKAGSTWLTTAIVGSAIVLTSVAGYYYFEKKAEDRKEKVEKIVAEENKAQSKTEKANSVDQEQADLKDGSISETAEENNIQPTNDLEKVETPIKEDAKPAEEAPSRSNSIAKTEDQNTTKKTSDKQSDPISNVQVDQTKESSTSNNEITSGNAVDAESNVNSSTTTNELGNTTSSGPEAVEEDENTDSKLDPNDPNAIITPVEEEIDHGILAVQQFKPANSFSPDNDGINDIFMIDPDSLDALGVSAISVKIFSPSTGRVIHQWNDKYGYWDGRTSNGTKAPEGPYLYQMILVKDGKEIPKQGTITIFR